LLEILRSAYEFEDIPLKKGDEDLLNQVSKDLVYKIEKKKAGMDDGVDGEIYFNDPFTKAFILLQCYFSRKPIPLDLLQDQKKNCGNIPKINFSYG